MTDALAKSISIQVQVRYLTEQSKPADNRFAFAYTITICNEGDRAAQLLDRHWIITDGNGKVQEVRGLGVVGEQPTLAPGESFRYTSGCVLETPVGTMQGSYRMHAADGHHFDAEIPPFMLAVPHVLH